MFEDFSERSLRVVFLARMGAGRRGAASLEPVDLLDAVVREDQGEMAAKFPGAVTSSGPLQPPERPFFSQEKASQILSAIEHILPPKADPLADSVDMGCSPTLGEVFAHATALAKELHHDKTLSIWVFPQHHSIRVNRDPRFNAGLGRGEGTNNEKC